ncbi:hypothetical protein [Bradyrhizobium sp. Ec3.3]|uniref:hypothetical protein n=1 Tax=Bradyrhizobium sp. Ec3.3 TaxID=189753 RepID=UPI000409277F|nr:hypothetical protein [Bradyrhizobium sp. Ec3.3]
MAVAADGSATTSIRGIITRYKLIVVPVLVQASKPASHRFAPMLIVADRQG